MRAAIILCFISLASACTTFHVEATRRDGSQLWVLHESTAPLLTKKASFTITHDWKDEADGRAYTSSITRNTDENAQPQVDALAILAEALANRY